MEEAKQPIRLPCGIICENCNTCVLRHYAVTEGKCWNCKTILSEDNVPIKKGKIRWFNWLRKTVQ